ncbi:MULTISPECIES: NirD/YgiW/YdeI family stress tolerance protein [unclassified Burkholderia]|uniref:NirD/YgiW/YdeI family stress tolerance protein n=1 Tax=unclassified Burkholderia TaxID=2613784 RepID=UPI002AB0EEFB|nr:MULTISPECIES: NirD/YgiW/YdeI family stress tolerance protein [unclassified Burkholderia]
MKKLIAAIALASVCINVFAADGGTATAPSEPVTVKQFLASAIDDQAASLRGHVTKSLGDDKYLFTDGTGELVVKIKRKLWPEGHSVAPERMVELSGKWDKEKSPDRSKLKVKQLRLLP